MTSNNGHRPDIYTRITNQIVAALEQGVKPWTQPWNAAHAAGHVSRPLRHNGQPYAGINVPTLWASAMERHYSAPIWMTFKQALELGGHVRKGEKGSPILKAYVVFNVEQVEGLPAHYHEVANAKPNPDKHIAHAESFFDATGFDIRHGGEG